MTVDCDRCDRSYLTVNALRQHERDSPNHHQCLDCDFDGSSWDELLEHVHDEGCGIAYDEHLDNYNVCPQCDRQFETPANLAAHEPTHRSAEYDCLGCNRDFTTYGGMMIHLESGACSSGIDIIDLNETAADCNQWGQYIDRDYRDNMSNRINLKHRYSGKVYPYKCPCCRVVFPKLSSLFQHVESPSCNQTLDNGVIKFLKKYLRNKYV